MEYKGIKFDAIVATPCSGKSYLCDKYPNFFVDVDELRLRIKYKIPENITRRQLEETKGNRNFEKRFTGKEYIENLTNAITNEFKSGKILICSPHSEIMNYLKEHNIKFCYVYQNSNMKEELKNRMIARGNAMSWIQENYELFDEYCKIGERESDSVIKYKFSHNEYLEDIVKNFGIKL